MELHCPNCDFVMVVKGVRAGRFTPTCSNCHAKFALTIPEGENAVPRVKKLPPAMATAALAGATMPPMATVAPSAASPASSSVSTIPPRASATVPDAALATPVPPSADAAIHRPRVAPHGHRPLSPDGSSVAMPSPPAPPVPPVPPRPSVTRPAISAHANDHADAHPATLGGYQVVRKLGQGGMGAVYLARQLSLDRLVAVKVLSPQLAQDAGFVARFTREAYAAAQLVHHNVVQVYDIGEDDGRHFYSMEYVHGDTLAGLVERDGKLDPESAVAYTLQAARGLKFAHDRGLIHRDVKPDNLMLSDQGIVKVADLGLVKKHGVADIANSVTGVGSQLDRVQSAETTGFNLSMGTPAYMAPEQARDAAHVDARADIYSLGCTLYDLLTGRPPFSGKTAMEVITKHASEAITPPDVLSRRVPKEVSALLMKMVAKRPEDRYADTGAVIAAMEDFLGTSSSGPFTPKEEHAAALESSGKAFRDAPLAKAARVAVPAYFGLLLLLTLLTAVFVSDLPGKIFWIGTFTGLAVLTAVAYVALTVITRRDVVLGRLRPLLAEARWGDWLRGLIAVGLLGMGLYVFGLLGMWAVVALVALGVAAAYHFGLQLPRDRQRKASVDAVQEMLRTMRLRGLEEETLRQFVCRYTGRHWEEFYESLFGYDAKLDARRRWGLSLRGKPRPKAGVWRDAVIAWANRRATAAKQAREKRLLAKTEEARLKADGMDLLAARAAARKEAAALVRQAEQPPVIAPPLEAVARAAVTAGPSPALTAVPTPVVHRPVVEDVVDREHESAFARKGGLPALVFGPTVRFAIAAVLIAAFVLWFRQNNPQFPQSFGRDAFATVDGTIATLQGGRDVVLKSVATPKPKAAAASSDLRFALLPQAVRHRLSGYAVGWAGLLLLLSCAVRGWKIGAATLIGAVVIILGDAVLPGAGGYGAGLVAAAAGTALVTLGFVYGRE